MRPIVFKLNGRVVTAAEFRRHKMLRLAKTNAGPHVQAYREDNPGRSMAMGCHRSQINLLNDAIHQHGISGVEYQPDKRGGKCVITNNSSKNGRRKWMKIYGQMHGLGALHDADSFD